MATGTAAANATTPQPPKSDHTKNHSTSRSNDHNKNDQKPPTTSHTTSHSPYFIIRTNDDPNILPTEPPRLLSITQPQSNIDRKYAEMMERLHTMQQNLHTIQNLIQQQIDCQTENRHRSATIIQQHYRGWHSRNCYHYIRYNILIIQYYWRCHRYKNLNTSPYDSYEDYDPDYYSDWSNDPDWTDASDDDDDDDDCYHFDPAQTLPANATTELRYNDYDPDYNSDWYDDPEWTDNELDNCNDDIDVKPNNPDTQNHATTTESNHHHTQDFYVYPFRIYNPTGNTNQTPHANRKQHPHTTLKPNATPFTPSKQQNNENEVILIPPILDDLRRNVLYRLRLPVEKRIQIHRERLRELYPIINPFLPPKPNPTTPTKPDSPHQTNFTPSTPPANNQVKKTSPKDQKSNTNPTTNTQATENHSPPTKPAETPPRKHHRSRPPQQQQKHQTPCTPTCTSGPRTPTMTNNTQTNINHRPSTKPAACFPRKHHRFRPFNHRHTHRIRPKIPKSKLWTGNPTHTTTQYRSTRRPSSRYRRKLEPHPTPNRTSQLPTSTTKMRPPRRHLKTAFRRNRRPRTQYKRTQHQAFRPPRKKHSVKKPTSTSRKQPTHANKTRQPSPSTNRPISEVRQHAIFNRSRQHVNHFVPLHHPPIPDPSTFQPP